PFAFVHHVDGVQAVALAEQAIIRRGHAAALRMAKVDAAGFEAGFFFNELGESFADARELRVAERIDLAGAKNLTALRQMTTFGNNDDAVMLAVIVVVLEQGTDMVDVDGLFRHES